MDLQKIINETLAGINATVRFLGEFGSTIFKLTFRPRVFIDSFAASAGRDHRQKTAAAFLFTLLLLVELSVGIFERVRDAYSSMSDVGIGVVLQADSIWELSSDVLVRRTLPLTITLLFVAWIGARLLGADRSASSRLQEAFPYALWRSTVLFVAFSTALVICLALLVVLNLTIPVLKGILLLIVGLNLGISIIVIAILAASLTLWRLDRFVARVNESIAPTPIPAWRRRLYSLLTVLALALPVWWSSIELSSGASKVALLPTDDSQLQDGKFSTSVRLRNLSSRRLIARKTGSRIQWWDDTNPVAENDLFSRTPVPNGVFLVDLPADTELKDDYALLTFVGDIKHARLTPRSYGVYDFMGGPEVPVPARSEYEATANSFDEILNDRRPGRIELTFVVATLGNEISYRTETIHRSASH